MTDFISRRHTLHALVSVAAGGSALSLVPGRSALAAQSSAASATSSAAISSAFASGHATETSSLVIRTASGPAQQLATSLSATAGRLDPQALLLATQALDAARRTSGLLDTQPSVLGIIDYSLPSTEKRLWVFDLRQRRLLHEEWVAHGRNSGDNMTERFSNVVDSRMSSLGAFVAGSTYSGSNGYSLRLRGLEPGFNDRAFDRAIVMHGAPYVNETIIRSMGRLGRSWGCPAMRPAIAHEVIDLMADGGFLFGYYPDRDWLAQSQLIGGVARLRA